MTRPDELDGTLAWRVSAHDLEQLVCERLSAQLADQHFLVDLAGDASAEVINHLLAKADVTAAALRSGSAQEKAELLEAGQPNRP